MLGSASGQITELLKNPGAQGLKLSYHASTCLQKVNPSPRGGVLVFAKDRRPFLKAYDFRFVFSFTAITPEPHSTGGKAEVNR